MADFEQAMGLLRKGKKVRRSSFPESMFWYMEEPLSGISQIFQRSLKHKGVEKIPNTLNCNGVDITYEDVFSDDWEIFKEEGITEKGKTLWHCKYCGEPTEDKNDFCGPYCEENGEKDGYEESDDRLKYIENQVKLCLKESCERYGEAFKNNDVENIILEGRSKTEYKTVMCIIKNSRNKERREYDNRLDKQPPTIN